MGGGKNPTYPPIFSNVFILVHYESPHVQIVVSITIHIEADITFNETKEYPYLCNVAAFNEATMKWMVVSRVRMDKQGKNAHKLAFSKTFNKCKTDYPEFEPGKTLLGVVVDWSDAEIQGLGSAVGPETARKLFHPLDKILTKN